MGVTNAAMVREHVPLAKTMMMCLQSAASTPTQKFFRNFPFMVEYRVVKGSSVDAEDGTENVALPIEVNALRHEGKSPTYAKLFHTAPLYDYFFKDLGDCDTDAMHRNIQRVSRSARCGQETTCCAEPFVELLRRGLRKPSQNNVTSADTVAAMVFAIFAWHFQVARRCYAP